LACNYDVCTLSRWTPSGSQRHGVTFEEAKTVFLDDYALLLADPDHSDDEARFLLLGVSANLRILMVCHCYREHAGEIRLISARKADPSERRQYSERSTK